MDMFFVHVLTMKQFSQVHADVSKVKIRVTEIPDELPENQMSDKLALSFSKSRNGGGEVESVEYDKQARSAVITFVETGGIHTFRKLKNVLPFKLGFAIFRKYSFLFLAF